MSPLSPSETRALLNRLERFPIKKLGQNFLVDGNIGRKSLEFAGVEKGDTIVEIGPGLGTLTRTLLEAGATVYAVEKDKRLAAYLATEQQTLGDCFHLVQGDAMDLPLAALPEGIEPFKIVANLPYAISTPWLESVLSGTRLPVSMTLMLQLEAAQRYAAVPGSKQFGSISVFLRAAYEIADSFKVKAHCFYPKPDVDSRLLLLMLKPNPYRFASDAKQLIRELFQQRRKQIGAVLKRSESPLAPIWRERLGTLGLSTTARAEQIATEDWIRLATL